ncbi:hypothetical protein DUI87_11589 [Hirundo rustica rustica]|uniref:Uncharacterized protein n=1 Tax=Hirundo rustica rustica TaxID=333673 RepID=A0A3M0KKK4_HIRRU|nr:hypothetical protein DUI87_11589 [Hirundo rustica rustica]
MSHCQQRCKRQLGRVIRFFYQFVTGTLSQALLGVQGIGMGTEGMAGHGTLTTLTVFLVYSQALRPAKAE